MALRRAEVWLRLKTTYKVGIREFRLLPAAQILGKLTATGQSNLPVRSNLQRVGPSVAFPTRDDAGKGGSHGRSLNTSDFF